MRAQFAFYKSFDDVYQDLNDKQRLEFISILLDVQFLRIKIEDVTFTDTILKHIWNAQKHSIDKSIKGYLESQKNSKIKEPYLGIYDPLHIPSEGVHKEEKEKEKGKDKEKDKGKGKRVMSSIDFNQEILTIPTNELNEKHFSLSKPSLFRDAPSEYLETLERYINNYVDKLEIEININGGNLSKVFKWDDFYLSAYNYEKKYVNFAMTYHAWARRSK